MLLRLWTYRPAIAPSDMELRWTQLDAQYRQRYGFDLDGRVEVRRRKGTL
jgi:hypothetical protein